MAPRLTTPSAGLLWTNCSAYSHGVVQEHEKVTLTACMRAPLLELPFATAIALSIPRSVFDFCLFTTIWEEPNELDAGRFPADIL